MRASALLGSWGVTSNADDIPILLLPYPVAVLLANNRWRNCLILSRWHHTLHLDLKRPRRKGQAPQVLPGPLPDWPPPNSSVWVDVGSNQIQDSQPLGRLSERNAHGAGAGGISFAPEACDELVSELRRWSEPILTAQTNEELVTGERIALEHAINMIASWAHAMREMAGEVRLPNVRSRFRHTSLRLLDCIQLSSYIRGGANNLVEIIRRSIAAAMPPILAQYFLSSLERRSASARLMPSPSSIRHSEFSLDLALMLYHKSNLPKKCIRYFWSDSSPMAGFDWLWSQYHEIDSDSLVSTFEAVRALVRGVKVWCDEERGSDEDTWERGDVPMDHVRRRTNPEWEPYLRSLKSNIREHINPPAALGTGCRGVADKAKAVTFAWALQTPCECRIIDHADTYLSQTSDMGVELSLPDFEITGHHESLLPEWVNRMPLELDIEPAEPPAPAYDPENDVDGPEIASGSEDAHPATIPSTTFLMPRALTIAGLQHIIDNLNSDVHHSLSHWKQFHGQLKQFEALLRNDDRRNRFTWTCLHGRAPQQAIDKFKNFKASLYEGRWHEVVRFLSRLLPLLPHLSHYWDHQRYIAGSDAAGEPQAQARARQRQAREIGGTSFEPHEITDALRSSLFSQYAHMAHMIEQSTSKLARWAEGCVCHMPLLPDLTEYQSRVLMQKHYNDTTCPMAGKLAPELVAGKLIAVAAHVWGETEADITALPILSGSAPLSQPERQIIFADFNHAKLVTLALLKVKTQFWETLP